MHPQQMTTHDEDHHSAMAMVGFAQTPKPASSRIHVDRNQEEDFILDGNPHCPNKIMPADNTTTNIQTSEAQPPSHKQ